MPHMPAFVSRCSGVPNDSRDQGLPNNFSLSFTIMRGKKFSTDLKYTVLALGNFHSVSEIEALTAVSRRQIYRIRSSWETTGYVEPEHVGKRTGRPRFLTADEEAASVSFFSRGAIAKIKSSMWLGVFRKRPISTLKTFNRKSLQTWGSRFHAS